MTEFDDEVLLARALLLKECAAVVIVQCQTTKGPRCPLGKVVRMKTGYRLAVKPLQLEVFDEGRPVDPNDAAWRPAWTFNIDDADAGEIPSRCKHGTWLIDRASLRPAVDQARRNRGKPIYVLANRAFHPGENL